MQAIQPAQTDIGGKRHDAIELIGNPPKLNCPRALGTQAKRLHIIEQSPQCGLRVKHNARGLGALLGALPNSLTKAQAGCEKRGHHTKEHEADEKLHKAEARFPS
jgi:hypothetical protein